jgi:nuclear pore complex protein Nup98-Nup96
MSDEDLKSVANFKISLQGVGYVKFLKPVDLLAASPNGSRALIEMIPGSVVILEPKMCTVYPDENVKPPIGFGLNVPAEINLEKCWPVDKATRTPIMDESDPRHDRHMKKLEKMADTRWLGFHNPTGSWRFQVDHFSRYGLVDDDESAEAVVPQDAQERVDPIVDTTRIDLVLEQEDIDGEFEESILKDSFAHVRKINSNGTDYEEYEQEDEEFDYDDEEEIEYEEDFEFEEEEDDDEEDDEAKADETTIMTIESLGEEDNEAAEIIAVPMTIQKKETARKVQAMKAAFFKRHEAEPSPRTFASSLFGKKPLEFKLTKKEEVLEDAFALGEKRSLKVPSDSETKSRVGFSGEKEGKSVLSPRKYLKRLPDSLKRVAFDKSLLYNRQKLAVDAGLYMGRSFRIGWGPDGTYIRFGR